MRLKNSHIGVLIIIIIVGGIYIAKGFGLWSTESDKVPIKITEGTGAGTYDPFDIRGSYSFGEISSLFEIDIKLLAEAFQLGDVEVAKDLKSKDLESLYGEQEGDIEIGNESVQVFVAIMKELDIKDSEAFLPMSAVQVLLEVDSNRSKEVLDYLANHQVEANVSGAIPEVETQPDSEGLKVNGNTTFSQVLDFGISVQEIESIIGAKMPPENQSVKSYCTENGLSFSVVKEALNSLIEP
ncbi:MAG: hypothetical protein SCL54_11320 [Bacillota bacterium]|nr:hypothetical protein [Bacillota bacterium]